MSGQLEGKVVLVSGGDSTLSRAAAERASREGAQVLPIDASASGVQAAAKRYGRLDALVNLLPDPLHWQPFAEKPEEDFAAVFAALRAATNAMRAAYPYLKETRGRVVNVGSVYGASAFAHISDRVTGDYALQGLSRAVAVEWAKDGVLVNYLGPGALDIPEFQAWRKSHPQAIDQRIRGLALQRLGDPVEDFGGALMFLLSDESCFIVGHPVLADGGQHLVAPVFEPGANL
ncbi:MAG: SDR family NAD(P)-dependent oxidoreductase [Steroidobacteraceae bacterium]